MARQAKALEAKLRIAEGDEDLSNDEEHDERANRDRSGWGKNKRHYYDADVLDMEGSDEDEILEEEEEEARKLQKNATAELHPSDFGVAEDGEESEAYESQEEEEDDQDEKTMGGLGVTVEPVPRDLSALDDEARAAAVRQDALELGSLISELRTALGEIRGRLGPLIKEVREGELATADGISYLEAKHTLLVHYAAAIMFYLLLKAEGHPVRDHPVVTRLVEIRAYIEKIRPIDKRLQYQIDKLVAAAQKAKSAQDTEEPDLQKGQETDAAKFGPRPEVLVASMKDSKNQEDFTEVGGVYKAPRINPVSMDLEENEKRNKRERRREQFGARRAATSTFMQELAAELEGAPEEVRGGDPLGMDTAAAKRERRRLSAREAVEEELMIRVPLTKEERKRLRAQKRAGLSGKALLDDFGDDLVDIIDKSNIDNSFTRHRANQKFGADLASIAARQPPRSGDADLPHRDSLRERRARMDAIRAKSAAEMEELASMKAIRHGEEDDFYKESKAAAAERKRRRKDAYHPAELPPPLEDPVAPGARHINSAIEKNRGLTPHRRKDLKNPRKKHRIKFDEANVRRKGQVQDIQPHAGNAYGGEATGIKSRVTKSVKF